ncbi:MAG TPA: hypothetical protein VD887_00235 [Allosphingosinicella sp.]|nr:hypothetical protein [Allosphingosinicella sp.]
MLYNWQTLIGGLIAIGAAVYAGRFVRRQINAGEKIEAERIRKREMAARAVLPLTLTKFIDFSEECAEMVRHLHATDIPAQSISGLTLTAPAIPQTAITDLERTIEAATDERAVELLTKLAGHTQVLHSILTDLVARTNMRGNRGYQRDPNRPVWELRTARVHAVASGMFRWARREVATPEDITWENIEASLSLLNIGDEAVAEMIKRARERQRPPLDW